MAGAQEGVGFVGEAVRRVAVRAQEGRLALCWAQPPAFCSWLTLEEGVLGLHAPGYSLRAGQCRRNWHEPGGKEAQRHGTRRRRQQWRRRAPQALWVGWRCVAWMALTRS